MEVKNSQLNNDTIQALNTLIELDINAVSAFKLTRIIKDISEIVELKLKMEKKILENSFQLTFECFGIINKELNGIQKQLANS